MTLFHGKGADFWPRSPAVDLLLSQALRRAGKTGSRSKALFASTRRDQAIEYAASRCSDNLFIVRPSSGAILSWAPGHPDLMLSFESWMNERRREQDAGSLQSLLNDIAGDIGTLEVYFTRRLQQRKTAAIADWFVRGLTVLETVYDDADGFDGLIGDHDGEIWITGLCELDPETSPSLAI